MGFITPRSGVQVSPPLPIDSITYSGQQWPLFVTVGRIASVCFCALRERVHRAPQATIRRVRVTCRCLNTSMAQDRHDSSSIHSCITESGCGRVPQVVEVKVFQFGLATGRAKSPLDVPSRSSSLSIHKHIFRVTRFLPERQQLLPCYLVHGNATTVT